MGITTDDIPSRIVILNHIPAAMAANEIIEHVTVKHGLPRYLALQISADALRRLCRDDHAQDIEDYS